MAKENKEIVEETVIDGEVKEVPQETTAEETTEVVAKKGGFKAGVSKVWNSKPARVIRKVGSYVLVAGLAVAGTAAVLTRDDNYAPEPEDDTVDLNEDEYTVKDAEE